MLGVSRLRRGRVASIWWTFAVIAALSFVLSYVWTTSSQAWAFFSLPARAWQLLAGGLIAFGAVRLRKLRPSVATALTWLGLATVLWSTVAFSGSTSYPGTAAHAPVLGTFAPVIGGCAAPPRRARVLLDHPWMQFCGRISYTWTSGTGQCSCLPGRGGRPLAEHAGERGTRRVQRRTRVRNHGPGRATDPLLGRAGCPRVAFTRAGRGAHGRGGRRDHVDERSPAVNRGPWDRTGTATAGCDGVGGLGSGRRFRRVGRVARRRAEHAQSGVGRTGPGGERTGRAREPVAVTCPRGVRQSRALPRRLRRLVHRLRRAPLRVRRPERHQDDRAARRLARVDVRAPGAFSTSSARPATGASSISPRRRARRSSTATSARCSTAASPSARSSTRTPTRASRPSIRPRWS